MNSMDSPNPSTIWLYDDEPPIEPVPVIVIITRVSLIFLGLVLFLYLLVSKPSQKRLVSKKIRQFPFRSSALPPHSPSSVEKLPLELIFKIIEELPSSSKLSLSYSCRLFRYSVYSSGFFIEMLFAPSRWSNPTESRHVRSQEMGDFLMMMELDKHLDVPYLSKQKLCCRGCHTRHEYECFSPDALKIQDPIYRSCRGREGSLVACPAMIMEFEHASILLGQRYASAAVLSTCDCKNHRANVSFIPNARQMLTLRVPRFVIETVIDAQHGILDPWFHQGLKETPVCPHLQLTSTNLRAGLNTLFGRYKNSFMNRFSYEILNCRVCNATVRFSICPKSENPRLNRWQWVFPRRIMLPKNCVFVVKISRFIEPLEGCKATDRKWLIHVTPPHCLKRRVRAGNASR